MTHAASSRAEDVVALIDASQQDVAKVDRPDTIIERLVIRAHTHET